MFLNNTGEIIECQENTLPDLLSYAVQVVGYSSSGNYWIVKNSMGTEWGQNGFGKISMNTTKDCGIRRYFVDIKKFEGIVRVGLAVLVLMLIGIWEISLIDFIRNSLLLLIICYYEFVIINLLWFKIDSYWTQNLSLRKKSTDNYLWYFMKLNLYLRILS